MRYLNGKKPFNRITIDNQIEDGYVLTSELEIKLQDNNGDGSNETLIVYKGKQYLFKLNEQGIPTVQAYSIQPAQIKEE